MTIPVLPSVMIVSPVCAMRLTAFKARYCRDFQGSCHDCSMGGSATHIDGEADHVFTLELSRVCGGKVVSHEDRVGRELMNLTFPKQCP